MNTDTRNPLSDDARLDRLVDGELSEKERRELLKSLEEEPGGWRRCALAFLEAQCWKESLGAMAREPRGEREGPPPSMQQPVARAEGRYSVWHRRIATATAMAASFLVALGLVTSMQRSRVVEQPGGMDIATVKGPANTSPANQLAGGNGESASNPWRLVTLSTPGDGVSPQRSIRVPAMERENVDEAWLRTLPSAIPDDVLRALARTGHEVQQRRELVPVPLQDGRRLVVPVDQVEVHYTGNPAY
ncbi:MAG: hypothetical protein LLG00_14565 [Planctomycetaceae bacterium]|nr:hypothetical protein [Planctomycetaceae bacterium]